MPSQRPRAKVRVPMAPLDNFLASRGGLYELPSLGMRVPTYDDQAQDYIFERTFQQSMLLRKTEVRLSNSRQRGWVDYFHADEIACDVLGVHPVEIWGSDWYQFSEDQDRHVGQVERVLRVVA